MVDPRWKRYLSSSRQATKGVSARGCGCAIFDRCNTAAADNGLGAMGRSELLIYQVEAAANLRRGIRKVVNASANWTAGYPSQFAHTLPTLSGSCCFVLFCADFC